MVVGHTNGVLSILARRSHDSTGGSSVTVSCDDGNNYDGRIGLRISAIFVILIGSFFGAWFPVYASRHRGIGVPDWAFFIAKYFGSGVIIATAFIHVSQLYNNRTEDDQKEASSADRKF